MSKQEERYKAPALDKGLDIIELLSGEEYGLKLTEIARRLSRSIGEIFRMLMVLNQRGYVCQDRHTGNYVLTARFFELAHRLPNVRRLTAVAYPQMRQLAIDIDQSVHLVIISNYEILVIAQVDGPSAVHMSLRLGSKAPIWETSSGRVLVAYKPDEEAEEIFDNVPLPDGVSKKVLKGELERIRRSGFEVHESFKVHGVINVSAPIFDYTGSAIATLTTPFIKKLKGGKDISECRKRLTLSAGEISLAMGRGADAPVESGKASQAA